MLSRRAKGHPASRGDLVYYTQRFHLVSEKVLSSGPFAGKALFQCTCKNYYKTKRCYQSQYFQHKEFLRVNGERIPGGGKKKKKTKTEVHRTAMQKVRTRKEERQTSAKTTPTSLFVTQDEEASEEDSDN